MIFVLSLLLLGMLSLFDWHNKVYYLEQAEVQATGSARTALSHMDKYIGQASTILASQDIGGTTYNSGATTVVLQIPAIDNNNDIIATTSDYVVYYVDGTQLFEVLQAGTNSIRKSATKQLSDSVNTLSFSYDNADYSQVRKVTVDLQTRAQARATQVNTHLTQTIFLRNR